MPSIVTESYPSRLHRGISEQTSRRCPDQRWKLPPCQGSINKMRQALMHEGHTSIGETSRQLAAHQDARAAGHSSTTAQRKSTQRNAGAKSKPTSPPQSKAVRDFREPQDESPQLMSVLMNDNNESKQHLQPCHIHQRRLCQGRKRALRGAAWTR